MDVVVERGRRAEAFFLDLPERIVGERVGVNAQHSVAQITAEAARPRILLLAPCCTERGWIRVSRSVGWRQRE